MEGIGKEEYSDKILRYLYNDMEADERRLFEAEVRSDPRLQALLEEEQRLQRLYPVDQLPPLGEQVVADSRVLLRAALRRQRRRAAWRDWLPSVGQLGKYGLRLAVAAGLVLGGMWLGRSGNGAASIGPVATADPVNWENMEIVDLRIRPAAAGEGVQLVFGAVASGLVEGPTDDPAVRAVLAAALEGGLEAAPRLAVIDLARGQADSDQIRQALIQVLLHDSNPGVRLEAIGALKDMAHDQQVRRALQQALRRDLNPGVRLEAVEALDSWRDPGTLAVFEEKSRADENSYIRFRAEQALQQVGSTQDEGQL
ncbi:MAG: hypothetical protein GKR89_30115 [Candidatus Latescibacteria bacterium]|nr:hypothetical protein [Candidatus Latescibacterota bacterium]